MILHSLVIDPPFVNVPSTLTYTIERDVAEPAGNFILVAVSKTYTSISLGPLTGTCLIAGVAAPQCYVESLSAAHWVIYAEIPQLLPANT